MNGQLFNSSGSANGTPTPPSNNSYPASLSSQSSRDASPSSGTRVGTNGPFPPHLYRNSPYGQQQIVQPHPLPPSSYQADIKQQVVTPARPAWNDSRPMADRSGQYPLSDPIYQMNTVAPNPSSSYTATTYAKSNQPFSQNSNLGRPELSNDIFPSSNFNTTNSKMTSTVHSSAYGRTHPVSKPTDTHTTYSNTLPARSHSYLNNETTNTVSSYISDTQQNDRPMPERPGQFPLSDPTYQMNTSSANLTSNFTATSSADVVMAQKTAMRSSPVQNPPPPQVNYAQEQSAMFNPPSVDQNTSSTTAIPSTTSSQSQDHLNAFHPPNVTLPTTSSTSSLMPQAHHQNSGDSNQTARFDTVQNTPSGGQTNQPDPTLPSRQNDLFPRVSPRSLHTNNPTAADSSPARMPITEQRLNAQQSMAAPQQSMNAPQNSMAAPQQSMNAPQNSMAAPQQSIAAPQQSIAAPQQSVAAPQHSMTATQHSMAATQQSMAATQQSMAATQQSMAPTQQSMAATQQSMAPTQQSMAATQHSMAAPQKLMAATQQSMNAPQNSMAAPQQLMAAPQQSLAAPQQSLAATQQSMAAPQQSVAGGDFFGRPPVSTVPGLNAAVSQIDSKGSAHSFPSFSQPNASTRFAPPVPTSSTNQPNPAPFSQSNFYNAQNPSAFPNTSNKFPPAPQIGNHIPAMPSSQPNARPYQPPAPSSTMARYPPPPPQSNTNRLPPLGANLPPSIPPSHQQQFAPPPVMTQPRPNVPPFQNRYPPAPAGMPPQNRYPQAPGPGPGPGPAPNNNFGAPPNLYNQSANLAGPYRPQPTFPPMRQAQQPTMDGLSNQFRGASIAQEGYNRLWGMETLDLLKTRDLLTKDKTEAPTIRLNPETFDAPNCSPDLFRCTLAKIPESKSLLEKSRLPLGVLIHPFKDLNQLSVIQCTTIVRCRTCRTYINPFVYFVDNKRWKCNLCFRVNELPEEFQFDPLTKTYGDPSRRPEIRSATIEYIAPSEYMVRPPQPAVYLFLLDVSRLGAECGYLSVVCQTLLEELDNLPGDARTSIGFITYDSAVHFYSLADGLSRPHQMTVVDIEDMFLPCPDNLLVNLNENIDLVRDLLTQLPTQYSESFDTESALGAALQAAYKMLAPTGGRATVFQARLPSVGPGALASREDPSQRAGDSVPHLNPSTDFYKKLALECSSNQVAVDLFFVNSQYVDIATLSGVSRFSGGCMHHFPLFRAVDLMQVKMLKKCLRRYLTRKIGFESVMRLRCTRGLSVHTFHGNFFVRSTDLLSLPNVNPDAGFGMQVSIDESLSELQTVCFQAALLYTSSKGERRIRVHTMCLPIANSLSDVLNSADQLCIVGLLSKMAVDRSMESSVSDAREAFVNVAADILSAYQLTQSSAPHGSLLAAYTLRLLPLYILALLKFIAFRIGQSTRLDDRVFAMCQLKSLPLAQLLQLVYPDLYPIHDLEKQPVVELGPDKEKVHDPPRLHLSAERLDSQGVYLLDNGYSMIVYVGHNCSANLCQALFGTPNFSALPHDTFDLPELDTSESDRLFSFIHHLCSEKAYVPCIQVIRDDSHHRMRFLEQLVEDKNESGTSYYEFLQRIKQLGK